MHRFRGLGMSVTFAALCAIAIALTYLPVRAQQGAASQKATRQRVASSQAAASATQRPQGEAFSSPEDAAAALYSAAHDNDEARLLVILGPNAKEMLAWSDDPAQRAVDRSVFTQKYNQMHRLVNEPDGTVALYVGAENWPLPIPLLEIDGRWYFDTEAGKKEVLFRRVGENEIEALNVCRALVDAEREYYDEARSYTSRLMSREGTHDGLYSDDPTPNNRNLIGPWLAHAGYPQPRDTGLAPFHGYYYRILTGQGAGAQGGARSYVANGKMTGGFAILAFPAEYQSSGVMTFVMDQDGIAYQKDLGATTNKLARQIMEFNPDNTWQKAD